MSDETRKYLSNFAMNVVKGARQNLTKKGKNDSNALYNSLGKEVTVGKNSFSLAFFMEEYGNYLDQGVKGKESSSRAPNSPFRFGTGSSTGGKSLSEIMTEYAKRKGFQWKDKKTGKFMSHQSMGYIMARSKYNKGVAPTMFFTKPFEAAFKRLPDELVEKFGLDIDNLLEHSLNKNKRK